MPSLARQTVGFLPNFCANGVVSAVVLVAQLLAIILALSLANSSEGFWLRLALLSLLIQWMVLGSVAALCLSRQWLNQLGTRLATVGAYGLIQLVTLSFSLLTLALIQTYHLNLDSASQTPSYFLLRNFAISSIVSILVLRYFYVQHQWQRQVTAEAQARLQALEARIRPHFLFNCLNTITSLIASKPEQAEEAVLDLADLFRSSLRPDDTVSLRDELNITRRYLHIESLRLGERLQVEWEIAENLPLDTPIPKLILQPLVENAVYHSIQKLSDGGTIKIAISADNHGLCMDVSNPDPVDSDQVHRGIGMAQENIRDRLALLYGDKSELTITRQAGQYRAMVKLPLAAAVAAPR